MHRIADPMTSGIIIVPWRVLPLIGACAFGEKRESMSRNLLRVAYNIIRCPSVAGKLAGAAELGQLAVALKHPTIGFVDEGFVSDQELDRLRPALESDTPLETIPDVPMRADQVSLVDKDSVKEVKGQGAAAKARHLLHALAHVELNAIDLYADTIARFAFAESLPLPALCDLARVASDEARHFEWLASRLQESYGLQYGDIAGHTGLRKLAEATNDHFGARLVVVPLV